MENDSPVLSEDLQTDLLDDSFDVDILDDSSDDPVSPVYLDLDLQPIIDRLDNIEALISVEPEPVSNDSVRTFNSLDQALLFLILIVATCIFLFRGKK